MDVYINICAAESLSVYLELNNIVNPYDTPIWNKNY